MSYTFVGYLFHDLVIKVQASARCGSGIRLQDQTLARLLAVTAAVHVIFAVWPSVDITVSRYFLLADGSFWLSHSVFAEDIRMPIWLASVALAVFSGVMLCVSLLRGALAKTSWRLWAFIATTYLLGPGLLVNVILKQNWGRARPVTIVDFGGDKLFTPPFEIADQCAGNCSFVSGEAASAAVMAIVLAICFGGAAAKQWRLVAYVGFGAVFILASGLRVATGRHFLSDVIFAGMFMLIIARLAYRGFEVQVPQSKALLADIWADLMGPSGPIGHLAAGMPDPLLSGAALSVQLAEPLQSPATL